MTRAELPARFVLSRNNGGDEPEILLDEKILTTEEEFSVRYWTLHERKNQGRLPYTVQLVSLADLDDTLIEIYGDLSWAAAQTLTPMSRDDPPPAPKSDRQLWDEQSARQKQRRVQVSRAEMRERARGGGPGFEPCPSCALMESCPHGWRACDRKAAWTKARRQNFNHLPRYGGYRAYGTCLFNPRSQR